MTQLTSHFFASLSARIQTLAAQGRDIIRLDEGSPDLPPAAHIIAALTEAARQPDAHAYQPHRASPALRQAWAGLYRRLYQVELDPQAEIIPLLGSKEGIFHAGLAWVEPGDIVLAPDPGYITYTRGAQIAGGEVYSVRLLPERGFLPDLQAIPEAVLRRARLLWLNFPNNPTAAVAGPDLFAQAVELAQRYDFLVCHDAAYMQVYFDDQRPPSLLQVPGAKDVAVEFNTLSKSHNMAGWRAGAVLGNAEALRRLFTLKTNADSGHFLPVWEGAIAALTGDQDWLIERNAVYRTRRDALVAGLRRAGLDAPMPRASLYVWAPVPAGWDCADFASAALEQAGVSFTPGTVFGPGGQGYVRVSITAPLERIEEAARRLERWLGGA